MKINNIILIIITVFSSNLFFGQMNDSIKKSIMETFKNNNRFKETIYELKGKELPSFELTLLNGEKINSESLKGKPTLINFWFINCPYCIQEIPSLNDLKTKFKNEVNFLSITFQDKKEVTEFLKSNKFNFKHVVDSRQYLTKFGRFGYPKTLIIDKNLIIKDIEKKLPSDTNTKKGEEIFKTKISNLLLELKNVR